MTTAGWIGWGVILASCALLARWAWWGDQARGRLRCPKCWYDMTGAVDRRCSECGHVARREKQLRKTRRRMKTGIWALLLGVVVGLAPFWKSVLRASVDYLPDTALIWLAGRTDVYQVENELHMRIVEDMAFCIWRWNRDALWDWQWRMLAAKSASPGSALDYMVSAAQVFAQPRPDKAVVVSHEEMMSLENDASGKRLGELNDRVQFPGDGFLPGYEKYLTVQWLELSATGGGSARFYLVRSSQRFVLYALRQQGDGWIFAGACHVESKYADPELGGVEGDDTICEVGGISTGGTGTWEGDAAWCTVDETGLHFVHAWSTGGYIGYGHAPFDYEYNSETSAIQHDRKSRYVDHELTIVIDNRGVNWAKPRASDRAEDVEAVAELGIVFKRTGKARYRWDDKARRFVYSASESDWTDSQVRGSFYDDDLFIEQNFDVLVEMAHGDDPAKRAWVRLVLTRMEDSAGKRRLERAIGERGGGG